MEQKQIKKLLKAVKDVCPEAYDVKIKQTQKKTVHLVIITEPPRTVDIHDWSISSVYPFHRNKICPLFDKPGDIRTLYCCGNRFVFFSPFNGVFKNFAGMIEYDGYGSEETLRYVGRCKNIDDLVAFITQTPRLRF